MHRRNVYSQPAGANAAQNNYERIQYCLDTYGIAKLADGIFEVNNVITVGSGKTLTAANITWPTIKAVAPVNSVIDIVGNNSEISFLQFDYNSQFKGEDHPCQGTIIITGSNNFIHNSFIRGADNPHRKNDLISTGVYFLDGVGNHVYNCKIYNSSYGVIFYSELEKLVPPTIGWKAAKSITTAATASPLTVMAKLWTARFIITATIA